MNTVKEHVLAGIIERIQLDNVILEGSMKDNSFKLGNIYFDKKGFVKILDNTELLVWNITYEKQIGLLIHNKDEEEKKPLLL